MSLSLGLRAFNEIDVVERVLEQFRFARYSQYKPALTVPAAAGEAQIEARLELLKNARSLLHEVEMAVAGFLMEPLTLPPTLSDL